MYNTFVKKTTQKSPRFAHFCCFVSSILGLSSSFEDGVIDAQIYHRASASLGTCSLCYYKNYIEMMLTCLRI